MSKEEFLSVYERQQASGLTIKDFCENEAYSSSGFHYWKKKFGLSRTHTNHPDKLPDDTFIPLDLCRRGNLPSGTGGDVTIELPSGIRIHLDSWRKRSIPTHLERHNPPTIIAKMGLKRA